MYIYYVLKVKISFEICQILHCFERVSRHIFSENSIGAIKLKFFRNCPTWKNSNWISHKIQTGFPTQHLQSSLQQAHFPALQLILELLEFCCCCFIFDSNLSDTSAFCQTRIIFLSVTKIHLFKENKFQSHLGFEIIGKILEIEEADEEKVGA